MAKNYFIKTILTLFLGYVPNGANYFSLTHTLILDVDEWENIYDYLIEEALIEPLYKSDKQIITEKGIRLINALN